MDSESHVPLRMRCEAFTGVRVGQSWWQAIVVWLRLLSVLEFFSFSSSKFTDCGKSLFAPVSPSWEFRWPIRSHKSATPEVCSSIIVMYRSFRSTEEGAHPVPAQETVAVRNPLGARWQDVVPGQARNGIAD